MWHNLSWVASSFRFYLFMFYSWMFQKDETCSWCGSHSEVRVVAFDCCDMLFTSEVINVAGLFSLYFYWGVLVLLLQCLHSFKLNMKSIRFQTCHKNHVRSYSVPILFMFYYMNEHATPIAIRSAGGVNGGRKHSTLYITIPSLSNMARYFIK